MLVESGEYCGYWLGKTVDYDVERCDQNGATSFKEEENIDLIANDNILANPRNTNSPFLVFEKIRHLQAGKNLVV